MKTKLSRKIKMAITVLLCIALSVYALIQWSADDDKINLGMVLVSLLIHVAVPSFLAWTVIYKKLTA